MPEEIDSLLRQMIDDLPEDGNYFIKTVTWDTEPNDEAGPLKVGLEVVWMKSDG